MATVRVDPRVHRLLKSMAEESGETMQAVLVRALEQERRRRFLENVNASYAKLSPDEQRELAGEHSAWEETLLDGLCDE